MRLLKIPLACVGLAMMSCSVWAQSMWGSGMYGGSQACQGGVQVASGASNSDDELNSINSDLKDAKSELTKAKSEIRKLQAEVDSQKDLFQLTGFDGDTFSLIENHISGQTACNTYKGAQPAPPAGSPPSNQGPPATPPAQTPDVNGQTETTPFSNDVWAGVCGPSAGSLKPSICSYEVDRAQGFEKSSCQKYLSAWISKQKALTQAQSKIAQLDAHVKELQAQLKIRKAEIKDEQKNGDPSDTEADCPMCNVMGNGSQGGARQNMNSGTNWGSVIGNVALGLGAVYLGNQQNQYVSDQNAKLGYPTQSYSSIGYGFPYFQSALYGAVSGGTSNGAFGCGGGMQSGGMQAGVGGAFGYPQGMAGMGGMSGYGNMMGGMGMMSNSGSMMGMGGMGMMSSYGSMMNGMGNMSSYGMMGGMGMMSSYGGMMGGGLYGGTNNSQLYQSYMTGYQTTSSLSYQMQLLASQYYQAIMNLNSGGYMLGTGTTTVPTYYLNSGSSILNTTNTTTSPAR